MCGIAGSINFRLTEKIFEDLLHRGPDSKGFFEKENVQLVHTRLAIQDIYNGNQPYIVNNFIIVFNGEIYNHLELRNKHLKEFEFKTSSDTETLLYLYIKYKENLFNFIDGMFAFAILDLRNKQLFLARDRAGKKPLYYYYDNKKFLFASELNALKNQLKLSIDLEAIEFFLRTGFFWKNTPFKNVFELEPGSWMKIDIKNLYISKKKYFDIFDLYNKNKNSFILDENEALFEIEKALKKSVYNRIISSDFEVAAFLSGGIDSSLIVAIAREFKSLKTFTVKFTGYYDESSIAAQIAEYLNLSHNIIEIDPKNLKKELEEILLSYGKPFFDSSAIPTYYISKEVSKHTKVILNGDGGDEVFGGYRRYLPFQLESFVKFLKNFSFFYKILPLPKKRNSIYNYIYRFLRALNKIEKSSISFYLSLTTDIFEDIYKFNEKNTYLQRLDNYITNILQFQGLDYVSKLLILDFNILLPADLLQKMDIATMRNSLEARSPFLSIEVLKIATKIHPSLKIKGKTTKYILRKLAAKFLPESITNLPKKGFEIPLETWIDNELYSLLRYYIIEKPVIYPNFIPKRFVSNIFHNEISLPPDKRAKILWNLLCLEIWGHAL